MKTVDQVITRFRRHYPGCDAATALDLFQTAYKRLLDKAEFRTADVTLSSIVAGQREYDWAEADLRVYGVTWFTSADSFRALRPTSEDALRDRDPAWKESTSTGDPCAFYLAAGTSGVVIGFDQTPGTTTTGGYPYAVCHCEEHVAISGSTAIPFSMLDEMYFVYAMCEFWAYEEDVTKAALWERKRVAEESVQIEHLKKLAPGEETVILAPAVMFRTRVR
ncbi:MAG TPA: hypothetical protein VHE55_11145 [Fimbriimonadaceae bacterium]|nr:hypothetical protein [Fimbriimonadaceae bacterium]